MAWLRHVVTGEIVGPLDPEGDAWANMLAMRTNDGTRTVWEQTGIQDISRPPPDDGDIGPGLPGTVMVRKFPFSFDMPGLATGAIVYTPTVGDVLLDCWIELVNPWDGTTPRGDVAAFGSDHGWFGYAASASGLSDGTIDMTFFDLEVLGNGLTISGSNQGPGCNTVLSAYNTAGGSTKLDRWVPGWFSGDPIKVCVSQNGAPTGVGGGVDPGSAQGDAILYLITATPL